MGCNRAAVTQKSNAEEDNITQINSVVKKPYILFLGALEIRKNLLGIIKSYNLVRQKGFDYSLKLVGPWGFGKDQIQKEFQNSPYKNDIQIMPFMVDSQVKNLYENATVFLFPSLYEGFGLPVLEAMACGTPVVTSNSSALSEIAGNAAIMVDPHSAESIADGVCQLLSDWQAQQKLKILGIERAMQYTWEACAKSTMEVYQKVWNEA